MVDVNHLTLHDEKEMILNCSFSSVCPDLQ